MKLAWKYFRLGVVPAVLLLCVGCSGINASHSISPATFLLPGLMQVQPEVPALPTEAELNPTQVAFHFEP